MLTRFLADLSKRTFFTAIAVLAANAGCHPSGKGNSANANVASGVSSAKKSESYSLPYPRATWRIAKPEILSRVSLWVSVILIRHRGSDGWVPFSPGWNIEPPPPARTREEALNLARQVAARAAAHPEQFSRLAEEYSDDIVSKRTKGSLGALPANQLLADDGAVLDAVVATGVGQVTRVIETHHGFEILLHRAPPTPADISGRVGVVPYDGAGWLYEKPSAHPPRSRDEAWNLARGWLDRIRADPAAFDQFVAQFPASGAPTDGSIGKWTTRETGSWSREREQLASLPVGGITEVLETPVGYAILRRTEASDVPDYTMQAVRIGYPPGPSPEALQSRERAFQLAMAVGGSLAKDPGPIGAFQKQYCCVGPERWSDGRQPHDFVLAAANLSVGAMTREPMDNGGSFVVARRIDPADGAPETLLALPTPATADAAEASAGGFSGPGVQVAIRSFGDEASASLGLPPDAAQRLKALHERFAPAFDVRKPPAEREKELALFEDGLHSILSEAQYKQYRTLADAKVASNRMQAW